jgi:hypothetical protein
VAGEEDEYQDVQKQTAVLQMSGNHLLHYVLNKKPSLTEYKFILNLMMTLIQNEVEIGLFFQNE